MKLLEQEFNSLKAEPFLKAKITWEGKQKDKNKEKTKFEDNHIVWKHKESLISFSLSYPMEAPRFITEKDGYG